MPMPPIASPERLKELGLDPAEYGSCSKPVQEGKGVWLNQGCARWKECTWRDSTEHMEPRDEADVYPRPRNVITKFVKPVDGGPGDRVISSYCSCFRFLGGLKRRDGRNREIAEVAGGEGGSVLLKMSERKTNPDGSVHFKPKVEKVTVPRYPDPTEVDELFEDVYAGQSRLEHKAQTVDADRERRLSGSVKKEAAQIVRVSGDGAT